jgi:hypothetical protein
MYFARRPSGTWELRESSVTPAGPRSRTLASFRTLTPEAIEHAQARASKPLDADGLRRMARRAGVPVETSKANRAASDLLAELAAGRAPRPELRRLLLEALDEPTRELASTVEELGPWLTATSAERGEALRDLLLLADRIPHRPAAPNSRFPRLDSSHGRTVAA